MKPTPREMAVTVRRTGVHFLMLTIGSAQWTGHEDEFAQLAIDIRKALNDNRID